MSIFKDPQKLANLCQKISKISIYVLVFLFPLFFLPWTFNFLDFNKQILIFCLVFISFLFWSLRVLVLGKGNFNLSIGHIFIFFILLVFLASTIFSLWPYGSFWGWPQSVSQSFLSLFCFILFYFLVANLFEREEIFFSAGFLFLSSAIAAIFGIFQSFGKYLIPFSFAKGNSFSFVGSLQDLAVFFAILMPLGMLLLIASRKSIFRIFFGISLLIIFFFMASIGFNMAWWAVGIGSVFVLIFCLLRKDITDGRWAILPALFLVLSLVFIIFNFRISDVIQKNADISLDYKNSFNIASSALKEKPILGTGPGTFVYNFLKNKGQSFNQSPLWSIRFERGAAKVFDISVSSGIIGLISFVLFIAFFFFSAFKFFFKGEKGALLRFIKFYNPKNQAQIEKSDDPKANFFWVLSAGFFSSFAVSSIGILGFSSNMTLDFLFFFFAAACASLFCSLKKDFLIKYSSIPGTIIILVFVAVSVFCFCILLMNGQRYLADVYYKNAFDGWQKGDVEKAITNLEKSVSLAPSSDLYQRELSQVYLTKVNEMAKNGAMADKTKSAQVQEIISKSINSAKKSTDANPANATDWSSRGFIYQNLIGVVSGADDWSMRSYEEAVRLDSTNPYYQLQMGIVLFSKAKLTTATDEKIKLLDQARSCFDKSLELKSDYAPAIFQKAIAWQEQGNKDEAVKEMEKAVAMNPYEFEYTFQLGYSYYQLGKIKEAGIMLERAVAISPENSNALYFLSMSYYQIDGLKDNAIAAMKKVVALNPDNEIAKKVYENMKAGKRALDGISGNTSP